MTAACLLSAVPCIDLGGKSLVAHRGDRGSIPDKSFGVGGGQSGIATGFPARMVFPCQDHSTDAPYTLINLLITVSKTRQNSIA